MAWNWRIIFSVSFLMTSLIVTTDHCRSSKRQYAQAWRELPTTAWFFVAETIKYYWMPKLASQFWSQRVLTARHDLKIPMSHFLRLKTAGPSTADWSAATNLRTPSTPLILMIVYWGLEPVCHGIDLSLSVLNCDHRVARVRQIAQLSAAVAACSCSSPSNGYWIWT